MEIKFTKAETLKAKPQPGDKLGFGHIFTDYMLIMPYDEGQGWHDPEIRPYAPIELSPAAMCFHLSQGDASDIHKNEYDVLDDFRATESPAGAQ